MKRKFFVCVSMCLCLGMNAQEIDSLRLEELQEVVVSGIRAQKDAPYAISNFSKAELQAFSKTGQEMPLLFAQSPSIMAWSENGMGTGTSYMRIRGVRDARINVTIDGVPLNSPEDQCVFWANMNSYSSLLGSVQIQRGVGNSTHGDGAFGANVILSTRAASPTPSFELTGSYGSYNTFNVGGSFSSGLLWNHVVIDGAYHETNTDGYVHGTAGRSGSYYGGISYANDHWLVSYKNIGNFEKTGQAWNGVTAGDNDLSIMDGTYGMATGIHSYKDMYEVGLGRYNTLYETIAYDADGNMSFVNGSYQTVRYRMADGSLWRQATDNFWQNHNILSATWDINPWWKMRGALHYTHGYGYYNEFRPNNKLSKFGLSTIALSDGSKLKRTDFIRKKGLEQDTYGLVWNINFKDSHWDAIGGLSLQQFRGNHFGYLTYVANETLRNQIMKGGKYQYYDSDAEKDDYTGYLKASYKFTPQLSIFGDAQYRHVNYKTDGYNDKFYSNDDGTYSNQPLDIDKKYDFVNLRGGVSYKTGGHHVFASVGNSHREPERNNFTDNGSLPAPKAEKMIDYELGYNYSGNTLRGGINLYWMKYIDQLVQTGLVSDIGEPLTTNIDDSYRAGIELTAGWDITPWLTIEGNAALSMNKIKDFDEVVEDWDNGSRTIHYDESTLAFSPSTILNGFITLHKNGWQAVWHTNFVGRQYLDNSENSQRSLPCFSVSDFSVSYTSKVAKVCPLKEVVIGMNVNNVFARRYAANGWVYSAICDSYGHGNDNRYYQIGFVPSAGFTAMGFLTLRF
ncbi:MAG: TonB-dependent receptor [Prevotella sp.]|nr:TonB-dependent receptor [Prevotella sp.]